MVSWAFLTRACAMSPYRSVENVAPQLSARASAIMKPALWRVHSYSGPMLPRPTMRYFIVVEWGIEKDKSLKRNKSFSFILFRGNG